MLKSEISSNEKLLLLTEFDQVLGLNLLSIETKEVVPLEVIDLAEARKKAKEQKEYTKADELRKQIEAKGYKIEDAKGEYILKKL